MPLTTGDRLGHYDVTALIGEGGMGQVYRATDTQLGRDVALKILPDAFAADPDRVARFQREAQVLASLNHPGIAAIYGIEKSDDTQALVLELVEGPTLADRIAKGPIPLDEALPIAKQIAEALEAAHEAGVIHRDLKPANIKVRDDGTVKVLDFGLAKALDTTPAGDPSQSPTLTAAATQMGVILGTAAYMSPEQARGKVADKRTDIWAFGAVLYEMLSGQRAFGGDDVSDTLAAVLRAEVDWNALPNGTPHPFGKLLRRCLKRDQRLRWQAAGDLRLELDELVNEPRGARAPTTPPGLMSWQVGVSWLVVATVSGIVTSGLLWNADESESTGGRVSYLTLDIEPAERLGSSRFIAATVLTRTAIALAPDGHQIAFTAWRDGEQRLYLRHLDRGEAEPLAGTEGAANPFFSPDGEWVGFWAGGQLWKIRTSGTPPIPLCTTIGSPIFGASWDV